MWTIQTGDQEMAEQPPNQTMIQIPQAEYNKLTTENRILTLQVQGSADEITHQADRIAKFRGQLKEKDLVIQTLKQQADAMGIKGQGAAEDAARLKVDNDKYEETDIKQVEEIKKLKATNARLEKKVKKLESSNKTG